MRHVDFIIHPSDALHIAALSDDHRDVINGFRDNTNYETLAASLQIPEGTLKSRLFRARARIVRLRLFAAAKIGAAA